MRTHKPKSMLGLTLRILRDEGVQAVQNRSIDRAKEKNRLKKLKGLNVIDGHLSIDFEPPPVLNVSPTPPSPKRGGSQIQMLDRLEVEKDRRTVALAYPKDGSWWLEVWAGPSSGIISLGPGSDLIEIIAHTAGLAGTKLIHVENISGLPLSLVRKLENHGLPTVLSVHDFTLFCRKPHLTEAATGEFCEYSKDPDRCAACLRDIDPEQRNTQIDYRRTGAEALASAAVVIYPSRFLHRQHQVLFPGRCASKMEIVIPPSSSRPDISVDRSAARAHVAFIGGVYPHKGGALITRTMEIVRSEKPKAAGFIYGNGDHTLLRQLRKAKNLRIRGYYRSGGLAELLARDKIAVAVLPSILPEAYGLVVDECLAARVPVVAFDHGAVADRLRFWEVDQLVSPKLGALGLAETIIDLLSTCPKISESTVKTLPQPEHTAHKHIELYRSLRPRRK